MVDQRNARVNIYSRFLMLSSRFQKTPVAEVIEVFDTIGPKVSH